MGLEGKGLGCTYTTYMRRRLRWVPYERTGTAFVYIHQVISWYTTLIDFSPGVFKAAKISNTLRQGLLARQSL